MAGSTKQLAISDGVTITDATPVEYLELTEQDSAPATPGTDKYRLYFDGGKFYIKGDDGTAKEVTIEGLVEGALTVKEIATPTTPDSGYQKIYPKSADGRWYTKNSDGDEIPVGSGSGSGTGINYVQNPDAEINVTDGVTASNVTVSAETASPLVGTQSFKATSTAATGTVDFALDTIDAVFISAGTLFKAEGFFKVTTGDTGDWKVGVHDGTSYVTGTDQDLANGLNIYRYTFVPESGKTYTLRLEHTTTDADDVVVFDKLDVGPGTVTQINAIGQETSFTPTWATGNGTLGTQKWTYQKIGNKMLIQGNSIWSAAGTTDLALTVPDSLTIGTTNLATGIGSAGNIGTAHFYNSDGTLINVLMPYVNSATSIKFAEENTSAAFSTASLGASHTISVTITVPIAEWAGATFLGNNHVEYAYNSGTWDATDTTSFGNGPSGAAIGGALTAARTKRVRFPTPIQPTDIICVQFSQNRIAWTDAPNGLLNNGSVTNSLSTAGTGETSSGVYYGGVSGSTTDVDVIFFRYRNIANDDTPAADWPSSNAYWRVVKHSAGQPVGFGEATDTLPGLRKAPSTFGPTNLNGEFTGGTIQGKKDQEGWVTLYISASTFSSDSQVLSSTGLVPSAFRPASQHENVYRFTASDIHKVAILTDGQVLIEFRDYAGTLAARTSASACSITYYVGT